MRKIVSTIAMIIAVVMLVIYFVEKPISTDYNINNSRQTAITQAIEKCSPTVVGINVTQLKRGQSNLFLDPFWGGYFPRMRTYKVESLGSGFIVSSDGYVITNSHVVEDALEIIVTLPGGKRYNAEVIGSDPPTDLALLKIDGDDFQFVEFGSSEDIIVGEWVIALGNPMGLFDIAKLPTATAGIISGLHMDFGEKESGHIYQDMIQTDASINQGNSGGPLINALGEVIGVNTFIMTGSGYTTGSIGIGFAIPIYRVENVMRDLKKFGRVERSFNTGVHLQSIDVYLQKYLNLPTTDGVIITEIEQNSAGEDAGLLVGDVILKVDNKKVNRGQDIMRIIGESFKKSGDFIELKIWREIELLEVKLELRERD
ncbi:MAG: trypsin-like peptidase domain-containing protein [Candidatus Marinimicrobia bacterium]|nr:trypsin-like peptidase domain-containing protein [Candidatus Neomarinimicrobiota bacterium]MBL7022905.1 trypsin-like peptidase domain-containing protein [Candidatus Neomarinimicrobiota bacterium]MBL7109224.1 trypsin-like peptidase domain-containing protein [Candidatus Neomarinimicrobiota bacterium]